MNDEIISMFGMLRGQVDKAFASAEPTCEDAKEVYARFGLAYYYAEVLYRGLCNLYCVAQLPEGGPVTRYRVEEHLRAAFEITLGQLLPRVEAILPEPVFKQLSAALERRNFIAHHFWYERIHLMGTLAGVEAILAELARDTELFQKVDKEVDHIIEPYYGRLGLTPERFAATIDDIKGGTADALEPLHAQRTPRKQETVVKVFNVPASSGGGNLVFQTDDGLLWQLCDAGLGWSPYTEADTSWPQAEKFGALLPAQINPRPKTSAPWTFDIAFGARATLMVRPGEPGQVLCRLRTRKQPHQPGIETPKRM